MNFRLLKNHLRGITFVMLFLVGTISLIGASLPASFQKEIGLSATGSIIADLFHTQTTNPFVVTATVTTDKSDYAPGQTVYINGSGFQAGEVVRLRVVDLQDGELNDTDPAHQPWNVGTTSSGTFTATWVVDPDSLGHTLVLTADGMSSGLHAEHTFTDNESADLDQCANDPAPSPNTDGCQGTPGEKGWVNGAVNGAKANYFEGDSIAYRMRFDGLTLTSHTVVVEWDTTKSGKHAIDYLTTWDRTVATADPCLNVSGCGGTPSTFAIPKDPQVDDGSGSPITQVAGNFTLFGGTIDSVTAYTYPDGAGFTGDKSARIAIHFTASQANPVLAWGGHISTRQDWGQDASAVAISGDPFHMRLKGLCPGSLTTETCTTGGNQDRALAADAVFFPITLEIIKETDPDTAQVKTFNYTTTGPDLSAFTLTPPDGTTPDSKSFSLLDISDRTVTESDPHATAPQFNLTNLSCTQTSGGLGTGTVNTSQATRTVSMTNLKEGQSVSCTFVNTEDFNATHGRIIVDKVTDPSGDPTLFSFTSDFSGSFQLADASTPLNSGLIVPNTYSVSETANSAYTTTANCTSSIGDADEAPSAIHLAAGETVTCTFTNTKKATIIVKKHMIGGTDTFAFTGDPNGSISTDNGTIQESVVPGTYTSTETLKSGWDLNSVSCDDSDSVGSVANHNAVFHAAAGETITCTFTNTKEATIIVKKHMVGGTASFAFTGDPNGSISTDNGTIQESVVPGTYTSTETLKTNWDLNSVTCDDSDSVGSVANHNAVFHAAAGETITCTFTNTKRATIIVKKHMVGGTDTFSFTGDPNGSISTDNGTIQESVVPGAYSAVEGAKTGWDLNSISCDDANSTGDTGTRTASFNAEAGETVTCTFTNTKQATIIVKKHMVGGTSTFAFTGDPNGSISTDNGTIQESVVPGTYTSTETLKAGWDLNSVSCDDSDSVGSVANHNAEFHAAAGETITCTFTNTKEATIIVKKHMVGGTASFAFTGDPNGSISTDNGTIQESVVPGTYTSTETLKTGWDLNSVSCDDSDSAGSVANHNAVFHAAAGETVTCTFTNTLRGRVLVDKVTDPSGDTQSFDFTGSFGAFSLTDAATPFDSGLIVPGTYAVSETALTGWDLTSATCSDGSAIGTINVSAGETVTCTFNNRKRGMAKVIKTVNGQAPTGSDSFLFQLRSGASASQAGTIIEGPTAANAGNGGIINFTTKLVPGTTYQLCEQMQPGWLTTLGPPLYSVFNPSGDNSVVCTDFTVSAGETKEFAINNQPPPGGMALTIGFWKNWASCAGSNGKQKPTLDRTLQLGDIVLGSYTLHDSNSNPDIASDCQAAVNLLNKMTVNGGKKMASDPIFNMVAQLVAADLNVLAGAGQSTAVMQIRACAHALLVAISFNGNTYSKPTAAQIAQANCLATALDQYNNNQTVQACTGCP